MNASLPSGLPSGFVFGAATAAAQIEGGADADGRTPSIWDVFAQVPGKIADGSDPSVTVDHYHRWREDVALLADLGVGAYRFSLSWSRLQPHGHGPVNPAGVRFYSELIDALLEHDIAPWVTLYHWDMPVELMEDGGWLARQTADAFADYAGLAARAFGDRVAAWMTLNEPVVHTGQGYALGIDAPGLTLLGDAFQAAHHQLLGHGRAVQALRETSSMIGIVNNHTLVQPASQSDGDLLAAGMYELYHNGQYAQPILAGSYPEALSMMPGGAMDCVRDGDLAEISAPLDFYGINYYNPTTVAGAFDNANVPFDFITPEGVPLTDFGWPVVPGALTTLLGQFRDTYPGMPPIFITENGAAYDDRVSDDGALAPDTARIAYLDGHLAAVAAAIDAGVDVRGYFHWSLLDNWEWSEGFSRRFGLVRVDPVTLDRTPRASFAHYRDIIAANRA